MPAEYMLVNTVLGNPFEGYWRHIYAVGHIFYFNKELLGFWFDSFCFFCYGDGE
jgi:hypothetical protein